jgi:hypothetical protein
MRMFADLGALILAAVLLLAAAAKIYYLDQFSWFILTVKFFPERYVDWLTFLIPFSEIAVGCALLHPRTRFVGLYGCAIMLIAYTGFLTALVITPDAPSCECFGSVKRSVDAAASNRIGLVRDLLLLGLVIRARRGLRTSTPAQPSGSA